jgi:hypothetical protein
MNYLKKFKNIYDNYKIEQICKRFGIKNYTINSDGTIDVDSDVYLNTSLDKLPIKFGRVSGNFYCDQIRLTSLVGSPYEISKDFDCYLNKLSTLDSSPKRVGGDFNCSNNELTSLKGAPEYVGGDFNCESNSLTSLIGCPEVVGADIIFKDNMIRDFKGISEFFEGQLYCNMNPVCEIWDLFYGDNKCIRWINEFDVIVDGRKIIFDRLVEVYHQLNIHVPRNLESKLNDLKIKKFYEII